MQLFASEVTERIGSSRGRLDDGWPEVPAPERVVSSDAATGTPARDATTG
ncbi:hypothetical protein ACFWFK_03410 [Micromonospora chalcea]